MMANVETVDAVVIGAGVVGGVIAHSLAREKMKVALIEKQCAAAAASGGNFGLIWVQSKSPAWYLRLTMTSASYYPEFLAELRETGVDVEYCHDGGLELLFSSESVDSRRNNLEWQTRIPGFKAELLSPKEISQMEPAISPHAIVAGVWSPLDGHLNPFALCRALVRSARKWGAIYKAGTEVTDILTDKGSTIEVVTSNGIISSPIVINAAGMNVNQILAMAKVPPLPVTGNRGQVIVTEPLPRLLTRPTNVVRQTAHGNVLIGCTTEPGSLDRQGSLQDVHDLAAKAIKVIPALADVNCIRTWSSPRVWPEDGLPILSKAASPEGLYTVATHSAISLCPYIGKVMTDWIIRGKEPPVELQLNELRRA